MRDSSIWDQPSNSSGEVARTALGLAFERSLRIEAARVFVWKKNS